MNTMRPLLDLGISGVSEMPTLCAGLESVGDVLTEPWPMPSLTPGQAVNAVIQVGGCCQMSTRHSH